MGWKFDKGSIALAAVFETQIRLVVRIDSSLKKAPFPDSGSSPMEVDGSSQPSFLGCGEDPGASDTAYADEAGGSARAFATAPKTRQASAPEAGALTTAAGVEGSHRMEADTQARGSRVAGEVSQVDRQKMQREVLVSLCTPISDVAKLSIAQMHMGSKDAAQRCTSDLAACIEGVWTAACACGSPPSLPLMSLVKQLWLTDPVRACASLRKVLLAPPQKEVPTQPSPTLPTPAQPTPVQPSETRACEPKPTENPPTEGKLYTLQQLETRAMETEPAGVQPTSTRPVGSQAAETELETQTQT
eukprot:gene31393-6553_t